MECWSDRHRDEQIRYANLHFSPIIGPIPCARLTRVDFQRVLDQAKTRSVGTQLQRCLTAMVNAGLIERHLSARKTSCGIDVILSARRVGPTGEAYGLDMTDEMPGLGSVSPLTFKST
ncbi:MAG: hypothetical protein NVS3B12_02870 [Acidimicrobiales bacterium]